MYRTKETRVIEISETVSRRQAYKITSKTARMHILSDNHFVYQLYLIVPRSP